MRTDRYTVFRVVVACLALAGCAASPQDELRQQEIEADVDDILSYELDPAEYGEQRSCLSDVEYRSHRALGDRHLLFEGRQDRLWVNVLRGRCPDLDRNSTFIWKKFANSSVCDKDQFNVVDSVASASMARTCILGVFKPVTRAQVEEIEDRLEMR